MNHRGPSAEGVRAKSNHRIQFDFMLDGVRYRPTIKRAPTAMTAKRKKLAEREGFEPSKGFWPLHP